MIAAKEYQRMVRRELLLVGKLLFEKTIRLLGGLGFDNPDSIHHSVHVSIHSDIWCIIKNRQYDFCRLYTHSWKGEESF